MALFVILLGVLGALGVLLYTNFVRVETVALPLLPPGLRLGQISDLHGRLAFVNGSLQKLVEGLGLDFLVVTGDIVKRPEELERVAKALKGLPVRGRVFLILGNYEHEIKEQVRKAFAGSPVSLLENAGMVEDFHGCRLFFYGFDNSDYGDEAYDPALEQVPAQVRLFLAHSPAIYRWMEKRGVTFDVLLCGHTHGNQIDLPMLKRVKNKYTRYHRGLKALPGGRFFYVNRGLGTSHIPVRLHAAPEITVFQGPEPS